MNDSKVENENRFSNLNSSGVDGVPEPEIHDIVQQVEEPAEQNEEQMMKDIAEKHFNRLFFNRVGNITPSPRDISEVDNESVF